MSAHTKLRFLVALCIAIISLGFMLPAAGTLATSPLRIMPLGDSITHGYNVPGGYRIKLYQQLVERGQAFDFVGSQQNGPTGLLDQDHEGHPGWRIDELDDQVDGWIPTFQPDVVLLLIGTNDMLQNYQPDTAPDRLSALIDHIYQLEPNCRIIVGTAPPLEWQEANARVQAYNAALPAIIQAEQLAGRKISLVDFYAILTLDDLADGVHPSLAGYNKMADAWFAELTKYDPFTASTPTSTFTPTPTSTFTPTPTSTFTPTPTQTNTPTPTQTNTPTPTSTLTPTATSTNTPTNIRKPTITPLVSPGGGPQGTATPTPTENITALPAATPATYVFIPYLRRAEP